MPQVVLMPRPCAVESPCLSGRVDKKNGNSTLCVNLSVLGGSAVTACLHSLNRRDAEHAEVYAES
jgi:hypothetical protein